MLETGSGGLAAGAAERWRSAVSEAYFPLDIAFPAAAAFRGALARASLGDIRLSRLRSRPVSYERRSAHIAADTEEAYLVTIPTVSAVEFTQRGRTVRCAPGGFLLEFGAEPYRFLYERPNDLLVMKLGAAALADCIAAPGRLAGAAFDAGQGVARIFVTMAAQAHAEAARTGEAARDAVGRQLLELLGLALGADPRAATSGASAVRAAHLARATRCIRERLADPDLSPETVAEACGISKRYLHALFRDAEATVAERILAERLAAARAAVAAPGATSIADIAYRFGFSDQAAFARQFRRAFGLPPSAWRREAAEARAAGR